MPVETIYTSLVVKPATPAHSFVIAVWCRRRSATVVVCRMKPAPVWCRRRHSGIPAKEASSCHQYGSTVPAPAAAAALLSVWLWTATRPGGRTTSRALFRFANRCQCEFRCSCGSHLELWAIDTGRGACRPAPCAQLRRAQTGRQSRCRQRPAAMAAWSFSLPG